MGELATWRSHVGTIGWDATGEPKFTPWGKGVLQRMGNHMNLAKHSSLTSKIKDNKESNLKESQQRLLTRQVHKPVWMRDYVLV